MATSENIKQDVQCVLIQIYGEDINKRYPLNGSMVHVGRALNAHVRINVISVSRKHCVLKKESEGWIIKDCGSQNGTYINGRRLQRNETMHLQFGDLIFLGPPSEYPIAFCFEDSFDKTEHIWVNMKPLDEEESQVSCDVQTSHSIRDSQPENTAVLQSTQADVNKNLTFNKDIESTTSHQMHNVAGSSKNGEQNKNSLTVICPKDASAATSYSVFKSPKHKKSNRSSQLTVNNQEEHENSQSLLDVESGVMLDADAYSSSQGFNGLVSSVLSENISQQTESSKSAAQNLETKSDDLKSKLAVLSEEIIKLEKSKSDLLREYAVACEKNKILDQQLTEQKKFTEDMHMYEQRLKNQFKDKIMGQLEEDLICNICTELLIKPTVLDCSHTFCEHCIKQWKKKKRQCPVCRNNIQSETRVLALDHFIDKTLETLTPEQKEMRRQLILEREQKKVPNSTPTGKRRKGRRRRAVHTSRRPRQIPVSSNDIQVQLMFSISSSSPDYRNNERPPLAGSSSVNLVPEIVITDENDSSAEEMDFQPPCYNCGQHGHQPHECPG